MMDEYYAGYDLDGDGLINMEELEEFMFGEYEEGDYDGEDYDWEEMTDEEY